MAYWCRAVVRRIDICVSGTRSPGSRCTQLTPVRKCATLLGRVTHVNWSVIDQFNTFDHLYIAGINARLLTEPNHRLAISIIRASSQTSRTLIARALSGHIARRRKHRHRRRRRNVALLACVRQASNATRAFRSQLFHRHTLSAVYVQSFAPIYAEWILCIRLRMLIINSAANIRIHSPRAIYRASSAYHCLQPKTLYPQADLSPVRMPLLSHTANHAEQVQSSFRIRNDSLPIAMQSFLCIGDHVRIYSLRFPA